MNSITRMAKAKAETPSCCSLWSAFNARKLSMKSQLKRLVTMVGLIGITLAAGAGGGCSTNPTCVATSPRGGEGGSTTPARAARPPQGAKPRANKPAGKKPDGDKPAVGKPPADKAS